MAILLPVQALCTMHVRQVDGVESGVGVRVLPIDVAVVGDRIEVGGSLSADIIRMKSSLSWSWTCFRPIPSMISRLVR